MTAVYGHLLAVGETPEQLIEACRAADWRRLAAIRKGEPFQEERLPLLPWTLEELVGSTWVNLWAGARAEVREIVADRWGYLDTMCYEPLTGYTTHLGTWRHELDGYCIEHWVRVDHLPATGQLQWFILRCDCECEQIANYLQRIANLQVSPNFGRSSTDGINLRGWKRDITHHEEQLAKAIADLERFAAEHQLVLPDDLGLRRERLHAEKTIRVGKTTLVQSALF